ncbi:hypothetical protein [Actinoplanes teichomyceticus]|uniref:hypothetical protein n=1 Tax=Actinoplanes teichomyceticus TaxID=1867 RepID=UPI0014781263|nr:hypothetical protein [Actinoplanes teichomyceticus]
MSGVVVDHDVPLDSRVDPDDQQRFAEAYAQRLHDAGIEIAAITDYTGSDSRGSI